MKGLLIGAVMITAMVDQLTAQANFPSNSGNVGVERALDRLLHGTLSRWEDTSCDRRPGRHEDWGFPYWGYACDPFFYPGNYGGDYPTPSVSVPQVVAPPPPAVPAPPIRPEVREYHWPSSPSDSSATTLSIVSKDGRVQSAIALWVQDNALCYITADGRESRMPIDFIDRQATRQRNAEKHLNFSLPAEISTAYLQASVSLTSKEH
jgi:hypothetical protein